MQSLSSIIAASPITKAPSGHPCERFTNLRTSVMEFYPICQVFLLADDSESNPIMLTDFCGNPMARLELLRATIGGFDTGKLCATRNIKQHPRIQHFLAQFQTYPDTWAAVVALDAKGHRVFGYTGDRYTVSGMIRQWLMDVVTQSTYKLTTRLADADDAAREEEEQAEDRTNEDQG